MPLHTVTSTLHPTPPFDFDRALAFVGHFPPTKGEQSVANRMLTQAVAVEGQPVVFQLESTGTVEAPELAYTLYAVQSISDETRAGAVGRITNYLRLEDDLRPFYAIGRQDPCLSPIIDDLYGLHHVCFLTPFECACWAVITQRNRVDIGRKMKRAITETYGTHLEVDGVTYWAFPEPEQMVGVEAGDLAALIHHEQKGEYLAAVIRAFAGMDERWLREAGYDEVYAWLRNVRGIGAWSAEFILLRCLGRADRFPVSSDMNYDAVSRIYGDGQKLTKRKVEDLAAEYHPWEGWWMFYLRVVR